MDEDVGTGIESEKAGGEKDCKGNRVFVIAVVSCVIATGASCWLMSSIFDALKMLAELP